MKKYLVLFLIFFNSSFALEVICDFEEVYQNGDTQQGLFMLKDKMLRYQYYEEDLYTIIAKNDRYFLVNNFKNEVVQKINENTEIIKNLVEISSNFPDIKDQYDEVGFKIKIEKNSNNFLKRIAINSDNLNLSINILNCDFVNINKKYFRPFNFENFNR